MSGSRSPQIYQLFEEACELPQQERAAFLQQRCGEDHQLLEAVESLLEASSAAGNFFDDLSQEVASKATTVLDEHWGADRHIGAYRIVDRIGSGGMGTVFLAERADGAFERQVALKIIPLGLDDDSARQRFASERRILGRLEHVHIAKLLDAGITEDHRPYLVMEYVDGVRITDYVSSQNLNQRERIRLFQQVLDAVQYAHQNLVIHRDLKPGNILVDKTGQVKLLDFGVAKLLDKSEDLTRTGQLLLTPQYAAPEQAAGQAVTTRTDVYQLGLVLHELITDTRFEGQVGLTGDLGTIVGKALHPEAERRYGSAAQLQDDLGRLLNAQPISARPDSFGYRAARFAARHPWGLTAFVSAILALVAFSWFSYQQAQRLERERDLANRVTDLLVDVFDAADPTTKGGEVSARHVLNTGTTSVLQGLETQPGLRSDLLLVLGRTYHNLGLYSEAQPLFEESLELRSDDVPTRKADAFLLLGENYRALGDYQKARSNARAALDLRESAFGLESLKYAEAAGRLGRILNIVGEREEAEGLLRSSLTLRKKLLPEGDPQIALAMDDLGSLHFARGDYPSVEALAREALEIRRRPDFPDQPALANNLNNLGLALNLQGKREAAVDYLREAVTMRRALLEANHPQLAQSLSNLGVVLEESAQLDEAFELFSEALAIRRSVLPAGHPATAQTLNNLGMAQRRLGDPEAALKSFAEARASFVERMGADHPAVASIDSNRGAAYLDLNDYKRALETFQLSLDTRQAKLPAGHPHLAYSLVGLSRALVALGQSERALELADEALTLREASLPPSSWLVAEAQFVKALAAKAEGESRTAQSLLQQSLPVLKAQRGESDPLTQAAQSALDQL